MIVNPNTRGVIISSCLDIIIEQQDQADLPNVSSFDTKLSFVMKATVCALLYSYSLYTGEVQRSYDDFLQSSYVPMNIGFVGS